MKKLGILLASLFVMTLATQQVKAQTASASAQAKATANIITPIKIAKGADLNFGNIVAGTSQGTVTVDTVGNRTAIGGVILPTAIPGTVNAAKFIVSGLPEATYAITLPTSTTISTSGGASMTVDEFTSNPSGSGLLTGGTQELYVGAKLTVNSNQPRGKYTGTFDVSVAYN
jgi:hypothetical protein